MSQHLGEVAALATSVMFSVAPTLFTLAGRQVGSVVVNRTRLLLAVLILATVHWLVYAAPLPMGAGPGRWLWFGLSGLVGLTLGDAALFQALVVIGTRLTMLLFSLSPVLSVFLAWLFLGEVLSPAQMAGIGLTVAGVAWVVGEPRSGHGASLGRRAFALGVLLALLGAAGQAGGLVLAKRGFAGDYPALSGQVIRMVTAAVALWSWSAARGTAGGTLGRLRQAPSAARYIVVATLAGPCLGVFLSLVAVKYAPVGVAGTLMALPPIFVLPISAVVFGERPSARAVAGTVVAVVGVAVLLLATAAT